MMGDWTFFSNHGHVLVCLARDSDARLRDVALQVGVTERAVQKIVRDLQDEGYLEVSKHGRRNRYRINNRKALRHPLQSGCTVGQLLALINRANATRIERTKGRLPEPAQPDTEATKVDLPETEPGQNEESPPETAPPDSAKPAEKSEGRPKRDLEQGRLF